MLSPLIVRSSSSPTLSSLPDTSAGRAAVAVCTVSGRHCTPAWSRAAAATSSGPTKALTLNGGLLELSSSPLY